MGSVAPAHHVGAARARCAGRDAGAGREGRKGGGMRVALTVPETRRLLHASGCTAEQQRHHVHWSHWRRTHQATAKRCHAARRVPCHPPLVHGQAAVVPVPGTPALSDKAVGAARTAVAAIRRWAGTPTRRTPPNPRGIAVDDARRRRMAGNSGRVRRLADALQPVPVMVPGWDMGADRRGTTIHRRVKVNCRCSTSTSCCCEMGGAIGSIARYSRNESPRRLSARSPC